MTSENKMFSSTISIDKLSASKKLFFTTGSTKLDTLIGGGIQTSAITQFYGLPSTGKTQICFTVCTLLPLGYKTIFLDTDGNLRAERIKQIAEYRGVDCKGIMQNIKILRIYDSKDLELIIEKIHKITKIDSERKLLIIDSIITPYDIDYPGSKHLPERIHRLSITMHRLLRIANENSIAVLITNHQSSSNGSKNHAGPTASNPINSCCSYIINLGKFRNDYRAKVYRNDIFRGSTLFTIKEGGVYNLQKN